MPKFFIPGAKDEAQAEGIYDAVRQFVDVPIEDRRIFSLTYKHRGSIYRAEVGKHHAMNGELVVAILERAEYPHGLFFVCTENRGVLRGEPILVGKHAVTSIADFDNSPPC